MNVTTANSGNYECRGVNNLGTDSATRYLRVRGIIGSLNLGLLYFSEQFFGNKTA